MRVVGKTIERKGENLKFANDGSYESVKDALYKISAKCYARVAAMGLSMEFDDVHQEILMSYVKARRAWNPQGGALFVTYCITACYNNFNNAIKKMERERAELGLVSIEAFAGNFGDSAMKDGYLGVAREMDLDSEYAPRHTEPEYRMDCAQQLTENMKCMSLGASLVVGKLLESELRGSADLKLRDIAKELRIEGAELRRIKLELINKFGVKWQ